MARLRRSMNDCIGHDLSHCFDHQLPVANIHFAVAESWERAFEALSIPNGVPRWPEEIPAHVVVDAMNLPTLGRKRCDYFTPDQPTRAGDQTFFH